MENSSSIAKSDSKIQTFWQIYYHTLSESR